MKVVFVIRDIINFARVKVLCGLFSEYEVLFVDCSLGLERALIRKQASKYNICSGSFFLENYKFLLDGQLCGSELRFIFDTFGTGVANEVSLLHSLCLMKKWPLYMIPHGTPLLFSDDAPFYSKTKFCDVVFLSSKVHKLESIKFFSHPSTRIIVAGDPILASQEDSSISLVESDGNRLDKSALFYKSRLPGKMQINTIRDFDEEVTAIENTLLSYSSEAYENVQIAMHPRESGIISSSLDHDAAVTMASSAIVLAIARRIKATVVDWARISSNASFVLEDLITHSFKHQGLWIGEIDNTGSDLLASCLGLECGVQNMLEMYKSVIVGGIE